MYRLCLALALVLGLQQTVSAEQYQARIIGGQDAEEQWPWMAELEISRSGDPTKAATLCGATLVAPQWVLTAAHCVSDSENQVTDAEDLFVALGEQDRNATPAERWQVSVVYRHPDYAPDIFHHDLALLKLSGATSMQPLDLAKTAQMDMLASDDPDEALQALGRGVTEDGSLAEHLQTVDLDYVTPSACSREWGDLTENQLCAGEMNPVDGQNQDTCSGDSGGPLVYRVGSRAWLLGVTSYGDQECATEGVPAVYSKVSAYLRWIEATTEGMMADMAVERDADTVYVHPGELAKVQLRVKNLSKVAHAEQIGVRIPHPDNVQVFSESLDCVTGSGYTDCTGDESLAPLAKSGWHAVSVSASEETIIQLQPRPLSLAHDYHYQTDRGTSLVFSNQPDLTLNLSTKEVDGEVRIVAHVHNQATHVSAARVRVAFSLPAGWEAEADTLCGGSVDIVCGLGDLAPGARTSHPLILSGEGEGLLDVRVWTDNGDFPAGDTSGSLRPAHARSATALSSGAGTGSSGSSGGGGHPGLWLLGLLGVLVFRRAH